VLGVLLTMLGLLFVFGMNVVIPLYLQSARGLEPLVASLTLAPGILLTVILGPVAGRLFDRHGGRWSIPLGYLTMAVFVTLVGVAAGFDSIVLFGALYVPAVLATAFIIGPAQTFALSHLDRETSPHGVTIVSTSFQIAGCVGTSLAAGIYGALSGAGIAAGRPEEDALLTGFHGAVALVVVTSLVGIVLAVAAQRASTKARAESIADAGSGVAAAEAGTVDSLMKTDVHSLRTDQSVLDALRFFVRRGISGAPVLDDAGRLAGFLSDGDVMRYLSAAHPSSTSIYSYAVGAADDLEQAMADLAELEVLRLATKDVITIDSGASIADAVAALSDVRLKKAPVVDAAGAVVGIVSRSAISRMAIAGYLETREAERVSVGA
jgi:DHA2 family lincomycin resistance protein-like MFS transporter